MIFLWIILSVMAYAFVGGVAASRHNAIASLKCYHHEKNGCWRGGWCGHCLTSVWVAGVFWPFGVPAMTGVLLGKANKVTRENNRRQQEIEEAEHRVRLAKLNAAETQALEQALKDDNVPEPIDSSGANITDKIKRWRTGSGMGYHSGGYL